MFHVVTDRKHFIGMMPDKALSISKAQSALWRRYQVPCFTGGFPHLYLRLYLRIFLSIAALLWEALTLATIHYRKGIQILERCLETLRYSSKEICHLCLTQLLICFLTTGFYFISFSPLQLFPGCKIYATQDNHCLCAFAGVWRHCRSGKGASLRCADCCGLEVECILGKLKARWRCLQNCWVPYYRPCLPG